MTDVRRLATRRRQRRFPRLVGGSAFAAAVASSMTPGCRRAPSGATSVCSGGPAVSVRSPDAAVGFDTPFVVTVTAACADARAGRVTWRQVSGARVRDLAPQDDGFTLRARTPSLTDTVAGPLPWGIVPLSPRTRGEVVLEAIWRDERGREETHEVHVAAAPRSRGLPNTPVGVRVYLGGTGWHVAAHPRGSAAAPEITGGATPVVSFLPDVTGDFRLLDGSGRTLALRAARYDETPLDCGRAGCHQAIADAAAASPMTSVLARGLSRDRYAPAFGPDYPACAIACHATGEPGLPDGGFAHVATELAAGATASASVTATAALSNLASRPWADLPRPLRRLGGVGCLACHGPGALPEASARWGILRPGVCATCHDAPPRYGHVVAWAGTAMARADHDTRAATDRACVRCHTTWGFLASLSDDKRDRRPPPSADGTIDATGISCAACHAVHAVHAPANAVPASTGHATASAGTSSPVPTSSPVAALLRAPPPPSILGDALVVPEKSRVCLGCHAPDRTTPIPFASAAALWLGRGGIDPATGDALNGPAPHAGVAGGCVGCHRQGPTGLTRGAGHGFAAGAKVCTSCHARPFPPGDLRARAFRMWTSYESARRSAAPAEVARPPHADAAHFDREAADAQGTPHASRASREPPRPRTPVQRALWDLALLVEDPAAEAHNAPYARALLAAAERTLGGATTSSPRRHE